MKPSLYTEINGKLTYTPPNDMNTITLKIRNGRMSPDLVSDIPAWRQFCVEAGFGRDLFQPVAHYDAILIAAGKHDFSLETINPFSLETINS